MENFEIWCGFVKKTGKLTGSTCHPDNKGFKVWKFKEMLAVGVDIKKMWALEFIDALHRQGVDLEQYTDVLEGKK